jgi:hypothetical protein
MKKKNKKGVISLYISFILFAIILITLTAVFAPMGVRFNTAMFEAGQQILIESNESIQNISNPVIKAQIGSMIDSAVDAGVTSIEVNSDIFQYSWVIFIVLGGIIVFLSARRLVEVGGAGGFV